MVRRVSGVFLATCMAAACLAVASGCQSWSQMGQGIPSGSRVPPPGTGTYQVPSSYYNNTSGAKAGTASTSQAPAPGGAGSSSVRTASADSAAGSGGVTTANWQVPTVDQMRTGINNTAAAALQNASNRANQAVQSGTSRAAAAVERVADPILAGAALPPATPMGTASSNAAGSPTSNPASRSLSDLPSASTASGAASAPADDPQLDWQPPQ